MSNWEKRGGIPTHAGPKRSVDCEKKGKKRGLGRVRWSVISRCHSEKGKNGKSAAEDRAQVSC